MNKPHKAIRPSLAEVKDYKPNRLQPTNLADQHASREPGVIYGVGCCESVAEIILESIDAIEKKLAIITRLETSDEKACVSESVLAYCALGDRLITLSERLKVAAARINYLTNHLEI